MRCTCRRSRRRFSGEHFGRRGCTCGRCNFQCSKHAHCDHTVHPGSGKRSRARVSAAAFESSFDHFLIMSTANHGGIHDSVATRELCESSTLTGQCDGPSRLPVLENSVSFKPSSSAADTKCGPTEPSQFSCPAKPVSQLPHEATDTKPSIPGPAQDAVSEHGSADTSAWEPRCLERGNTSTAFLAKWLHMQHMSSMTDELESEHHKSGSELSCRATAVPFQHIQNSTTFDAQTGQHAVNSQHETDASSAHYEAATDSAADHSTSTLYTSRLPKSLPLPTAVELECRVTSINDDGCSRADKKRKLTTHPPATA